MRTMQRKRTCGAVRFNPSIIGCMACLAALTSPAAPAAPVAEEADAELVPISAFTDDAAAATVSISPGGEYLALTLRKDGKSAFQVRSYPDMEVKASYQLGDKREVAGAIWVSDHILVGTPAERVRGLSSETRALTGELVTIDARSGRTQRVGWGGVLDILPNAPNQILISGSRDRFGEAHRLNLRLPASRQNSRRVARSPVPRNSFVVDEKGRVAFAVGVDEQNRTVVYHRKSGADWRQVQRHDMDAPGWVPLRFGPKPGTFYTADSRDGATNGLGLYDTADGSHTMLFRHDHVDVGAQLLCDYNCRRVYGVNVRHHFPQAVYIDRTHPLATVHAGLAKTYPDDFVQLGSMTRDHKLAIAFVSGDRRPGDYLLVDVAARRTEPLLAARPNLPPEALSPMAPVEIATRDGMTIYGYLTSSPSAQRPGPLVVLVHGGPHGVRDHWGFNAEAQLLASRGYHVLQVNYRGSGGYGHAYQNAGFGEWGRGIEDDVADATRWTVQSGIADPRRICIFGHSYGAYSALMGAAREPTLYRCAIGGAGIYDLSLLDATGDTRSRRSGLAYLRHVVGDDAEELAARSPAQQASRIAARVLLMHGGQDRRAPPIHAHRMRDALESSGNDPEWLFMSGQGHGFFGNAARLEVYERVLGFLEENIGASSSQ